MGLWHSFDDQRRSARAAAILALVGAINLPIIKFSVDWWNTLHQGASILRFDGPSIHPEILTPLLFMFAGFVTYFATVLLMRIECEILAQKIRVLQFSVVKE